MEEPNCESFETWGFTDRSSYASAPQNPLPLDSDMNPKKAYTAMVSTLENFSRSHSAVIYRTTGVIVSEDEHAFRRSFALISSVPMLMMSIVNLF